MGVCCCCGLCCCVRIYDKECRRRIKPQQYYVRGKSCEYPGVYCSLYIRHERQIYSNRGVPSACLAGSLPTAVDTCCCRGLPYGTHSRGTYVSYIRTRRCVNPTSRTTVWLRDTEFGMAVVVNTDCCTGSRGSTCLRDLLSCTPVLITCII